MPLRRTNSRWKIMVKWICEKCENLYIKFDGLPGEGLSPKLFVRIYGIFLKQEFF
jgi:hypothetical protein